jgi:hypothetical protein
MSDVGGMLYDKDAVYIDIPDWKVGGPGTFEEAVGRNRYFPDYSVVPPFFKRSILAVLDTDTPLVP